MSNGDTHTGAYRVKRPKVSAEYQSKMGAVDSHNFRRQSGRGTKALEKVCVTRSGKDRVYINMVGWVMTNTYLCKKFFEWNGEEKKTSQEVQEAVALALTANQWGAEALNNRDSTLSSSSPEEATNGPSKCVKHPHGNANFCKYCYKHKTQFVCIGCSNPQGTKTRRNRGRINTDVSKISRPGYMHFLIFLNLLLLFCKGECYRKHNCGHVPSRRPRGSRSVQFDIWCENH